MVFTVALSLLLGQVGNSDFHGYGPYRSGVPTPNSILGYAIGDRHTVYMDQDRVIRSIVASSPDRVKVFGYGKSTEGRELRYIVTSSPSNMNRLEEIRKAHAELAQTPSKKRAQELSENLPPIVWVNQCIHGDETASFESAMELVYNLVASENESLKSALEKVVVIVNPSYNPDGHERYVVTYNSIPNGDPGRGGYDSAIPSAFYGRANHYRFDMNRDRIAMSQAETQQEVRAFLSWNPQVYVDQHGQVETYFFPPVQQSINTNIDRERYEKWTEIFGRATASAFDQKGWTYYIRDQFDLYNACYLDSHTSLMGAIGMTHETDGGRVLVSERSDDTLLTMKDGAMKHLTSAIAVITESAKKSKELIASYSEFKEKAVSGQHAGNFQRVVIEGDARQLERLSDHLKRSGIVSGLASQSWKQKDAHDLWSDWAGEKEFSAGSLVVDMNQSQGPLAKALLEAKSDFEPDFIKRQLDFAKMQLTGEGESDIDWFEFYDSTAWALPFGYQLNAWWCESRPNIQTLAPFSMVSDFESSPVGYLVKYSDETDILAIADALNSGIKVSSNSRSYVLDGVDVPKGSFIILAARNEAGYETKLKSISIKRGVSFVPIPTSYPDQGRHGPGSGNMFQLVTPKIGVVFGDAGSISGGALWFTMEKVFELPFRKLSTNGVTSALKDLTCLVVPEGVNLRMSDELKTWISDGGTLVAFSGNRWLNLDSIKVESQSATYALPGAIFKSLVSDKSNLTAGYDRHEFAIPVDGNAFEVKNESTVLAISQSEKGSNLLSGWVFEESESELIDTSWLTDTNVGRGRVINFGFDPTYRAQWPGLHRMILNSMILSRSQ